MSNFGERAKEIIFTPANYMKFYFSRFPERKVPTILTEVLALLCLLVWIFSGSKVIGIVFALCIISLLLLLFV